MFFLVLAWASLLCLRCWHFLHRECIFRNVKACGNLKADLKFFWLLHSKGMPSEANHLDLSISTNSISTWWLDLLHLYYQKHLKMYCIPHIVFWKVAHIHSDSFLRQYSVWNEKQHLVSYHITSWSLVYTPSSEYIELTCILYNNQYHFLNQRIFCFCRLSNYKSSFRIDCVVYVQKHGL